MTTHREPSNTYCVLELTSGEAGLAMRKLFDTQCFRSGLAPQFLLDRPTKLIPWTNSLDGMNEADVRNLCTISPPS